MGCTRMGMAERRSPAWRKAANEGKIQSNSLPWPLRLRKVADGRGVLVYWRTTGAREVVSQELNFGNSEYRLGEADGETLDVE